MFWKYEKKLTGEHPCRSAISIKLQINFNEITLWHGWSPVNLLDIFWTPIPKNCSGGLLLETQLTSNKKQLVFSRENSVSSNLPIRVDK